MQNQIITCLIGDPVQHSVSDLMFGKFAEHFSLDYVHAKFHVRTSERMGLKNAIYGIRTLGITGANITLPYKTEVIKHLDEVEKGHLR